MLRKSMATANFRTIIKPVQFLRKTRTGVILNLYPRMALPRNAIPASHIT